MASHALVQMKKAFARVERLRAVEPDWRKVSRLSIGLDVSTTHDTLDGVEWGDCRGPRHSSLRCPPRTRAGACSCSATDGLISRRRELSVAVIHGKKLDRKA